MVCAKEIERLLADRGLAVEEVPLGPNAHLIVTRCGGRVFGPFVDGADALGWCPAPDAFAAALAAGDWNIGGERVWLAPEASFNFTDAARIVETYRVDPALDPGAWHLERAGAAIRFGLQAEIALADGSGRIAVEIVRTLAPRPAHVLIGGVREFGYRQRIVVEQRAGPPLPLVPWLIRQVAPVGTAFLDARNGARGEPVFGAPPAAAIAPQDGWWRVPFHGPGFMKTCYRRASLRNGAIGLMAEATVNTALLCRPVLADAERYPETHPRAPGSAGQCAALFYDDGRFGAYGEIELYGHRDPSGPGVLEVAVLCLVGPAEALMAEVGLAADDPQAKTPSERA